MDAPRIVIGLADDIASELARDGSHDKKSLKEIATEFAGEKRLSRLSALLSEPDYRAVQATRLVDEDPNHDCRAQARLEEDIRSESGLPVPTLLGLFVLDLSGFDEVRTDALLERLRELIKPDAVTEQPPELETAYHDHGIGMAHDPAIGEQLPSVVGSYYDQHYLTSAGINLPVLGSGEEAEGWKQYNGAGVQFIQIDLGWNVEHEAFNPIVRQQSPGTNFADRYIQHGNSGLGIVLANGEASKIRGIAPGCTLKGLYALQHEEGPSHKHLENGIMLAVKNLVAGDVILLALEVYDTHLPVEVKPAIFRAIRAATSRGIIVIEAAANQGGPLEDRLHYPKDAASWTDQRKDAREFHGFPDSGAIIVGGCLPTNGAQYGHPVQDPGTRCGKRVDCYAWSKDVLTSRSAPSDYGPFTGTSAAAPAIAGLALIIQQCAKKCLGKPLTPSEMRALFRDPTFGTVIQPVNTATGEATTDPASSMSMPDAMKLFRWLERHSS